jgi:Flp pilus assembly protein TadG
MQALWNAVNWIWNRSRQRQRRFFIEDDGAQIVELAITLPLLVVVFVGIYDFGQAFNLKQKMIAAAREGARFAASQSTADLTNPTPPSILAIRDVVHDVLTSPANKVNDCGLGAASATHVANTWTWTFTASCGAGRSLTLSINRGFTYVVPASPGSGNQSITVEATKVTLNYPYQWQFSKVIQILPGATTTGPNVIPADGLMQNLN